VHVLLFKAALVAHFICEESESEEEEE